MDIAADTAETRRMSLHVTTTAADKNLGIRTCRVSLQQKPQDLSVGIAAEAT